MSRPAVSCVMVTRDRARPAERAIECFAAQTWAERELVILDDGAEDYTPLVQRHGGRPESATSGSRQRRSGGSAICATWRSSSPTAS